MDLAHLIREQKRAAKEQQLYLGGFPRFGYKKQGDKLFEDPAQQRQITLILGLVALGWSYGRIGALLKLWPAQVRRIFYYGVGTRC